MREQQSPAGQEDIRFLQSLSEPELAELVLVPLLERMGYVSIRYLHGLVETGRDIVFTSDDPLRGPLHHAATVDCGLRDQHTSQQVIREAALRLKHALRTLYISPFTGELITISEAYYVTPFTLPEPLLSSIASDLGGERGRVRVIDGPALAKLIERHIPELARLVSAEPPHVSYGAAGPQLVMYTGPTGLHIRPAGIIGTGAVPGGFSRLRAAQNALLTPLKDQFAAFTQEEIGELEELLNSPNTKELDLQRFFEGHQSFLGRWGYQSVHPQVTLTQPGGALVPDFILTDSRLHRAAILDLKLPGVALVRRQQNRDRFGGAVMEARSQLLRYRDWFRAEANRLTLKMRVGMEIYEPRLIAVIGRTSQFQDEVERQQLSADNPDIEIATYDDVLAFAERRMVISW